VGRGCEPTTPGYMPVVLSSSVRRRYAGGPDRNGSMYGPDLVWRHEPRGGMKGEIG